MPARTIAIGDIHGCRTALSTLLNAIEPTPDDTIIFLGDYVDRGTDSCGVIEDIIRLKEKCRVVTLRGNHEIMMQNAFADESGEHVEFWLSVGGQATVESYGGAINKIPDSHGTFLRRLKDYHETKTHIYVHANYQPALPMHKQHPNWLFWEHVVYSLVPAPHVSGKTVIVGHTPQISGKILDVGHLIGIDTGCAVGGRLTAMDVATKQIWQADESGYLF